MNVFAPLQAIEDLVYRRICPLYSFDEGGRVHMVGSAVPFKSRNLAFLITATHVCINRRKQIIPLFTWDAGGPRVLGQQRLAWEYKLGQTPDVDITLIALTEEDVANLIKCYQFSDFQSITTASMITPGIHYMFAGYPSVRNKIKSRNCSPPALATYLITGNIQSVNNFNLIDKSDSYHFALCFKGEKVHTSSGSPFRIPKPQGMSGGGVWRLDIDVRSRLATIPLLVGVGIEYHKSEQLFVASRIQNIIPLANDLASLLSGVNPKDVFSINKAKINDG